METPFGAVVRLDFCLVAQENALKNGLETIYGEQAESLDVTSFGLSPGREISRRKDVSVEYYGTTDLSTVEANLTAREQAKLRDVEGEEVNVDELDETELESVEEYQQRHIALIRDSGEFDLSDFRSMETYVLQQNSRNFLDVVTIGTVRKNASSNLVIEDGGHGKNSSHRGRICSSGCQKKCRPSATSIHRIQQISGPIQVSFTSIPT